MMYKIVERIEYNARWKCEKEKLIENDRDEYSDNTIATMN